MPALTKDYGFTFDTAVERLPKDTKTAFLDWLWQVPIGTTAANLGLTIRAASALRLDAKKRLQAALSRAQFE